jgi:hypothetical protein
MQHSHESRGGEIPAEDRWRSNMSGRDYEQSYKEENPHCYERVFEEARSHWSQRLLNVYLGPKA